MKNNWSNLSKGDVLYVLVGNRLNDEQTVRYNLQKSEVINVHHYQDHCNVKFKYTNNEGKRSRCELYVSYAYDDNDYVFGFGKWSYLGDPQFIVTYKDPNCMKTAYKEIVNKQIDKVEEIMENYREALHMLREDKYSLDKTFNDSI